MCRFLILMSEHEPTSPGKSSCFAERPCCGKSIERDKIMENKSTVVVVVVVVVVIVAVGPLSRPQPV